MENKIYRSKRLFDGKVIKINQKGDYVNSKGTLLKPHRNTGDYGCGVNFLSIHPVERK